MFTRKFDRRVRVFLGVFLLAVTIGHVFGVYALWGANLEKGYQPEQPLYFPHAVMAGKHGIPCLYCHSNAETGATAGMPTIATCMKCHKEVQPKDSQGRVRATIQALLDHWEKKTPIEWVKVHDLADFAYFDHSRHLTKKAGLTCADCHGPVETMDRVERVHSLKMKWCLDCHRQAPPEGAPPEQTTRAPTNCSTCHR